MRKLIINRTFGIGFLLGIFLIALLNIFLPADRLDFNNLSNYGFPFAFYRIGYGEGEGTEQISEFLRPGLTGDVLFALAVSFLAGVSLRFLADKKPNLE
ncbi:MAG TPA: hypothetical protein VGC76_11535 [Pyrinomonadaceae bacterium]|jgi:hypothetical protein